MVGPTFSPRLETLFNEGSGQLTESEVRIWHMWRLVGKGFKPWEIEADYEPDERIIKPEDKADLFKLDQFDYNARQKQQAKLNQRQGMKAKAKGYI